MRTQHPSLPSQVMRLSAIREGAMPFDELLTAAAALQGSMERVSTTTRLPADVDREGADDLLLPMLQKIPVTPWTS